jgi:CRP-like cAMP-binding protein
MTSPLTRNLKNFVRFTAGEAAELDRLASARRIQLGPRAEIVAEGDPPRHVHVILEGWACRYRELADGSRQILALCLPGDLCDERVLTLQRMDHSLGSLTDVTIGQVNPTVLAALCTAHPRIARAVAWSSQVQAALQREWTVNLGQRDAVGRVAHLLSEIHMRLRLVGLAGPAGCEMPLTQAELGDATGLSTVHVNRVLQELRAARVIGLKDRALTIPNLAALHEAARFDGAYLHADREGRHLDAEE